MEFSSWSVVKGDGAFRGLFVWDRVRMSDRKVVRFPAIFQIFRLFDHYVRVFFAFFCWYSSYQSHTNSPRNAPSPFTTDQLENSINNRPILLNLRNFEKGGVLKVTSGMDGHFWFRSHDVRAAAVASGDRSQLKKLKKNDNNGFLH
jgi:hypothetical protein